MTLDSNKIIFFTDLIPKNENDGSKEIIEYINNNNSYIQNTNIHIEKNIDDFLQKKFKNFKSANFTRSYILLIEI